MCFSHFFLRKKPKTDYFCSTEEYNMLQFLIFLCKINLTKYISKQESGASETDAAKTNKWRETKPFGRIL